MTIGYDIGYSIWYSLRYLCVYVWGYSRRYPIRYSIGYPGNLFLEILEEDRIPPIQICKTNKISKNISIF